MEYYAGDFPRTKTSECPISGVAAPFVKLVIV